MHLVAAELLTQRPQCGEQQATGGISDELVVSHDEGPALFQVLIDGCPGCHASIIIILWCDFVFYYSKKDSHLVSSELNEHFVS
jgi:hypothetical protein